ncbi:MAG: SH3 domain-containing protein, partial [Candidatus Methylomirabilis sp.]|nr:SH3 domain-containing protein [Deltaproteobacteria bacterium]
LFYFTKGPGKGDLPSLPSCVPERAEKTPEAAPAGSPSGSAFWTTREAGAALRGGPGASYSALAELPKSAILKELARKPGWVYVQTEDGRKGWVDAGNLARAQPRLPR